MLSVKEVNKIFKQCEDELNVMVESKMIEVEDILLEQQVFKELIDWKEEVEGYFANYHDEKEEESEFNRLLYSSVELQLVYNDTNFITLLNSVATEIGEEIDDIIQQYASNLMNGQSMSRKQYDQIIHRFGMVQRRTDNKAVDMICSIANSTFKDIEIATLETTRTLIDYRGRIYWNKVLEAIDELESGSMNEIEDELEINKRKPNRRATNAKDMMKLATENGFEFIRQTGSHRVYNKEGKVTIIPVHGSKDLGKGLSHKIQKQIKN